MDAGGLPPVGPQLPAGDGGGANIDGGGNEAVLRHLVHRVGRVLGRVNDEVARMDLEQPAENKLCEGGGGEGREQRSKGMRTRGWENKEKVAG